MRTIILIAALALAACRTTADMAEVAQNYPPPPIEALNLRSDEWATAQERFIKFFRKAFFVDGEVNIGAPLPLTRRPRGQVALLSFEGDIDAATRAAFIYNVNLIGQVTGVPYRVVGPARDVRYGDIAVRVVDGGEVKRLAREGGTDADAYCLTGVYWSRRGGGWEPSLTKGISNGLIGGAIIRLADDRRPTWLGCVTEELAHAYGLNGDGWLGIKSAFGVNKPPGRAFTNTDLAALWLLYHPDLRPGMTWAEAEPIVRRIVAETWPETSVPRSE